jgi:hypothetical protein
MGGAGITEYTDPYDNTYNLQRCCVLMPIGPNALNGKVTIPATFNGVPVVGLVGFNNQSGLTHLFFENEGKNIRVFYEDCCLNLHSLVYVQWPESTRYIYRTAFKGCSGLTLNNEFNRMHLYALGESAFNQSFSAIEDGMTTIKFRGCFRYTGQNAITYLPLINEPTEAAKWTNLDVQFGDVGDPSLFELIAPNANRTFLQQNDGKCVKNFIIYADADRYSTLSGVNASSNTIWYEWVNMASGYFINYSAGTYEA